MEELLLFLVCVVCISLRKSYRYLSVTPRTGQSRTPSYLYRTLRHVEFLEALLEIILLAVFALFAISTAFSIELMWAFPAVFAGLVLVFIILPKLAATTLETWFATVLSKPIAYVLVRLEGPIDSLENLLAKTRRSIDRPQPLSKEALKVLLAEQVEAAEPTAQSLLALAGLKLAGEKTGHYMVRWNKVKFVNADEEVGPVLLSELHSSGRKVFPAQDAGSQTAGIIRLDGLNELKEGGKAGDVLIRQIIVAGKDDPAITVIKRFIESGAELIFAEDETGEPVGVVYLEDVLAGLAEALDDKPSL